MRRTKGYFILRCPFCEKKVKHNVLKSWSKFIKGEDGDDPSDWIDWYVVRRSYHTRGIIRKHRCKGSGKRFKIQR